MVVADLEIGELEHLWRSVFKSNISHILTKGQASFYLEEKEPLFKHIKHIKNCKVQVF